MIYRVSKIGHFGKHVIQYNWIQIYRITTEVNLATVDDRRVNNVWKYLVLMKRSCESVFNTNEVTAVW